MKTMYRRPLRSLIPGYSENGGLQLIVVNGTCFVIFHFIRVLLLITGTHKEEVYTIMFPNVSLGSYNFWVHKWWTVLTYGWVHPGFWDWATNMIWVYCFGSVLQAITNYKQIIPLFFYAVVAGGFFYLASQYIPSPYFNVGSVYFCGSQAGVMALGIAALVMAPGYRMHITPSFNIPFVLVVAIYAALDIVANIPHQLNVLMLIAGGGLAGLVYALLLKNGKRPGEWIYDIRERLGDMVTPDSQKILRKKNLRRNEIIRHMNENRSTASKLRIDEILDKINATGYQSLSKTEKDILLRAGKDLE
jgi:membrane associated rhomboid family serine protease